MTKRLYYDCPIAALYMMKEFRVVFITGDMGYYKYEDCVPYTLEHLSTRKKFYVAKESESIFEPRYGDLSFFQDHPYIYSPDKESGDKWCSFYKNYFHEDLPIEKRDEKQFFDAKREGE